MSDGLTTLDLQIGLEYVQNLLKLRDLLRESHKKCENYILADYLEDRSVAMNNHISGILRLLAELQTGDNDV